MHTVSLLDDPKDYVVLWWARASGMQLSINSEDGSEAHGHAITKRLYNVPLFSKRNTNSGQIWKLFRKRNKTKSQYHEPCGWVEPQWDFGV